MFSHFYHGTLAKLTRAVGSLFSRIYLVRYNGDAEVERMLVPLNYASRHSYISRVESQPFLEDKVYVEAKFPRISFEMMGLQFDPTRKLNTIHRSRTDLGADNKVKTAYQSVPYNIEYSVTIVAKHMLDANQILEQILPYFTPSYTITINSIPAMGYDENITLELMQVSFSDNYADEFESQRQIRFDLSLVAKGFFHGPVEESGIVQKVQVDMLDPKNFKPETLSETPRSARYSVETDPPNAQVGDDFGYSETWEEFSDGKRYNPVTGEDEEI